jgi:dienelactone hydrolase
MNLPSLFKYDQSASPDIRLVKVDGIYRDLTYATPFAYRRAAYLIGPEGDGPFPAILYVHWYEPWAPTCNRRQFLDEALQLAQQGVVSLLVETMWSDQDWFIKRTQTDDEENSIRQVIELRQALDLLLAHPGVDPQRVAYVGHDFGAMYGVLLGKVDPRPACYVLMAGTPRFPEWYLYYPELVGEARDAYTKYMTRLDPITHVSSLSPAPLLFQFGRHDFHVPEERARDFFDAASEPKDLRWYDCGHGLNELATSERLTWLIDQLVLNEANQKS